MPQISIIRARKKKHEVHWDLFDAGNWKSWNICNFQAHDRKFKHFFGRVNIRSSVSVMYKFQ